MNPTLTQLKVILTQLKSSLNESADALGQTGGTLESVDTALENITADLKALQSSETYQHLISLEGIDSDSISDFMSSPVSINSKILYDVENYGSGMTPFYTNLALWVGGLILVSILKQEVDRDGKIHRFTASQAYFGRWMLFMAVGLVQGLIVCLGDIVLLKVQCVHPVAFVCVGIFCSFIYVNLIYALALTFKHIGKALGVVLVILQIPGSAGTYPIEMTPAFFQKLHPLLPFTYGISAMRECIAGMYGANIWKYLGILAIFFPISIFIGLVLRPLLMNLNHLFDKRLSETELMLGETETAERKRPELTMMMKTLMEDDEWKQEFLERSEKFEKRYPKMIRFGFLGMIIIPLIFLILMFSLESKLVFLVLWIISLIALALYLICVEYIHDKMLKQLAAGGFKDITRIASSSPVMWEQICENNSSNIKTLLTSMIHDLQEVIDQLDKENGAYVNEYFKEAGDYRNSVPDHSIGLFDKVHKLYVHIPDQPGTIATVTSLLAFNNISLKNIGIIYNREFEEGVLEIVLYDEESCQKGAQVLEERNYIVHIR